jgi:cobalamin biosynthesis Mg chelatase CobN
VAAAEQLLERVIADSHEVTEGGEFLPLGVWGVRGFDVEAIRSHTPQEDQKFDKVLGAVYRVRVLQTRRTQVTRNQRTHRLTVPLDRAPPPQQALLDDAATTAAAAEAAAAEAAAALAIEDGLPDEQPSSSNSSNSSNSSSSSSSRKKKKSKKGSKKTKKGTKKSKKHKKSKKDKKDESRQARTHTDVASLSFM